MAQNKDGDLEVFAVGATDNSVIHQREIIEGQLPRSGAGSFAFGISGQGHRVFWHFGT